jgi:hypothetical protein
MADAELAEIEAVKAEEGRVTWRDLFGKRFRGPMLAGIGLAVISALDGINAIMYYSTKMYKTCPAMDIALARVRRDFDLRYPFRCHRFKIAGQDDATMSSLAVGITNFGASVAALWIVNSFRRKTLLYVGIVGQILGLALAAAPLLVPQVTSQGGWVMVAGVLFFVVCFAFSSGPLAWVIISEVFPLGARGKGAGVATACNWLANYVVAMVYPVAVGSQEGREQQRRVGYSFVAFGVICFLSLFYIAAFVPETHQQSLEQIEEDFEGRRLRARARKSARQAARASGGAAAADGDSPSPLEAPGRRGMGTEAPPS